MKATRKATRKAAPIRSLLRLTDVSRSYGDRSVLRAVTMELASARCTVLVGDNGSGKSTLLRLACGREQPTSGEVRFDGEPLHEDSPRTRARVATVMEAGSAYPDLTVREHLMLVAVGHGLGRRAGETVDRVLADHRLAGHAGSRPSALSSGQTQSLLLASAFVRPHDLLVLDEPEQRLDARARVELAQRLTAHKRRGAAILLATHDDGLAAAVADHVLTLEDGRATVAPVGGNR
ncbi:MULTISPECIES: ABC transporter ATP-binding protein [Streptomyces]|uniref:ABC transporter ATP-binding protein n=1 Tax=Streptomyces TaxID=1883 RepID=UPI000F6DC7FD|nr:ABC transporter ATP-binding protein [Streptomyces sp. W1SF4]AZM89777.1 ABC transporter ATP-binding protein [Streptomyces sp. W1SF4]